MSYTAIADVTRVEVRDDYQQSRVATLCDFFPKTRVESHSSGKMTASYRLPDLTNGLVSGSLKQWFRGNPGPQPRQPGESTVSLPNPTGRATDAEGHPVDLEYDQRFNRYSSKIVRHYDQCYRQFDIDLVAYLGSTTVFQTESFTGPDLDDYLATGQPLVDINSKLRSTSGSVALRDYAGLMSGGGSLELWCVMDEEVARVLAAHPDYSGRLVVGTALGGSDGGSIRGNLTGKPIQMPMADFAATFKSVHGFDNVVVVPRAVYNSARLGQTASVTAIADGLLWMGIVDTGSYDLTTGNEGPDGAIALYMPDPMTPEDNLWRPQDGSKMELFSAHIEYGILSPRYSADSLKLGIIWDSTTIFS